MLGGVMNADDVFVCIVETPKGSRNLYAYDAALGGIKLVRQLSSAATLPVDYGFLRDTRAPDGHPVDAFVCVHRPTFPGCLISVTPVGLIRMRDEKAADHKIVCVPVNDPHWNGCRQLVDLREPLRGEIEHLLRSCRLMRTEQVQVSGWAGREEALAEIARARH